jgi:hypothetical protein
MIEKRERGKGRRRDIEREGEIREREVRDIERESERERHRTLPSRVCALVENRRKSPKRRNKAQRKVNYKNYVPITMRRNYDMKLSATRNYQEKLSQEIMS